MAAVKIQAYLSPTMVLLAFDWPDGAARDDFLGFAILRRPGFRGAAQSWLPNRISFDGPPANHADIDSNRAPIQKFMWWDARIDSTDRGSQFRYTVTPITGEPSSLTFASEAEASTEVTIPHVVENGIGTYFNRAVVSSQAFVAHFGTKPEGHTLERALIWLGNGLQDAVPAFLSTASAIDGAIYHIAIDGAIYHIKDTRWIIPALEQFKGPTTLVYNSTSKDDENAPYIERMGAANSNLKFFPRTRAAIMHDKFLVALDGDSASAVLTGSANFTTGGLTVQANVLHSFQSQELADLYLKRASLLESDPTKGSVAAEAEWSNAIQVGDAAVRVFFPPEKKPSRASIDRVVDAVRKARQSVLFCVYTPTDQVLREEIFKAGDDAKMMFGIVNTISSEEPDASSTRADAVARVALYHRSREKRDVFAHALFDQGTAPDGFWWEVANLQMPNAEGETDAEGHFPVYIHHKFLVIDGETDSPIVYTRSANMSGNSLWNNDENLLEITNCRRLARIYMAEFLRLYEHYRARAIVQKSGNGSRQLKLAKDGSWKRKYYVAGSPEDKARENMAK